MARTKKTDAVRLGRPHYFGSKRYEHESAQAAGVLLANLGTPEAPDAQAVRPYLRQFLGDPRVVEAPRALWWLLLNMLIVPLRAPQSAAAYRKIWTAQGSPLLAISRSLCTKLTKALGGSFEVELGMSYGNPSIGAALRALHSRNCRKILVLPLYPQYAGCTVGTVFDSVSRELSSWRWVPQLRFVAGYCTRPRYPELLAASLREHRTRHGAPAMTLFSFHGTQLASLEAGDPYHCQCQRTARQSAALAGLGPDEHMVAFQSRFGRDPWLRPYTSDVLQELPKRGVRNVQVICPAFAADCLETLEEIEIVNRSAFMNAGGERFSYVPALNDRPEHIEFLAELVRDETDGWAKAADAERNADALATRARRARQTAALTRGEPQP